jgi:transcriptional regulator with XRE-family HTH domain
VAHLAEQAGLEAPILTLIEDGAMRPTPRQLIQIAQSLGVSLSRLFFPK